MKIKHFLFMFFLCLLLLISTRAIQTSKDGNEFGLTKESKTKIFNDDWRTWGGLPWGPIWGEENNGGGEEEGGQEGGHGRGAKVEGEDNGSVKDNGSRTDNEIGEWHVRGPIIGSGDKEGGHGRGEKGEGEDNGSVKDNGSRKDKKIGEGWHLRGPIGSGGGFNNRNGGRTRRGRP